jgi:hypothetical protein
MEKIEFWRDIVLISNLKTRFVAVALKETKKHGNNTGVLSVCSPNFYSNKYILKSIKKNLSKEFL